MTSLSTTHVLTLDDHRLRRLRRRRVTESLLAADGDRQSLVGHLAEMADLVSADRVSARWVDEYGPGVPHPHVVVDLLSDRPRRSFSTAPLHAARESGVPGVWEHQEGRGRSGGWGFVISLGSDGTRAWFIVADAVSPRPTPDGATRDRLLFLSGECSSVVLHGDLDTFEGSSREGETRFPGWHVLRDLEGVDEDGEEGRRIALRFVVARLPALLLEDELAVPDERRAEQARRAREEIGARLDDADGHHEAELWFRVLADLESGAFGDLAASLLKLGVEVASQGHAHGAGEILEVSYRMAAALGEVDTAIESARMGGRTARHRGDWAAAHRWYEVARGVAAADQRPHQVAVILEGVAITHRERGNLPAARTTLEEALSTAEGSGDRFARARVHHGFLGLEQASGDLARAVHHGWRAVTLYESREDRTRGLAGLAALFQEMGRLDAAEDAWLLVRHLSDEEYYTLYAVDALSHIAALRGDAAGFARLAAESDALGWDRGPKGAKAEILLYRGLSYQALGRVDEARRWLLRALAFAEEAGFTRALFQAERALESLGSGVPSRPPVQEPAPTPEASEVEEGLHAMRCDLVGSPV